MGWPGTGMLTRGLGIPGRGEAWLGALPANEAPALGELNFATKSGRGGTTGRAAGWPANGRAPEGEAGARGDSGSAGIAAVHFDGREDPAPGAGSSRPSKCTAAIPADPLSPLAPASPSGARPFAGQPAARPVVPPRPDLVAKLSSPRAGASFAGSAPSQASPRPGIPKPLVSMPVPGQPIYRGPIRPGQPMGAKAGVRPGTPTARPGGPRPQHPTSRGRLEPGLAPPVEQPRGRPGDKRGAARPQRERIEE